jgi:hypothetical protein
VTIGLAMLGRPQPDHLQLHVTCNTFHC